MRLPIKKVLSNKVVLYILTRYMTYFIQFVFSVFIAVKLGPYYFGIWGFILLILNYFSLFNFGISNSINILLVQNKNDVQKSNDLIKTSLILTLGLGLLIGLFTAYYYLYGISYFDKYQLKNIFFIIAIIALLTHYNNLFSTIFRVKNDIFKVSFFQSVIPVLCLITLILGGGKDLIVYLLIAYITGNVVSILLFTNDKRIDFTGKYSNQNSKEILNKGFFLFIYNTSFYLIMMSTRSIISYYYKVEEFGAFSFTFVLSNAILLLLNAFSFIIFPKMIDKLSSQNKTEIKNYFLLIRDNYITLSYLLMFAVIVIYPVVLYFLPQYAHTRTLFNYTCLTLLLNVAPFSYGSFLMAQNREKKLALFATIALILNVTGALFIVKGLQATYENVILATLIAYFIYALMITIYSNKIIDGNLNFIDAFNDLFPLKLLVPLLLAVFFAFLDIPLLNIITLMIFVFLNFKEMKQIVSMVKRILNSPNIINI